MPVTKNFGLRLEILDELLGGMKRYDFDGLLERINEKLEDYGLKKISKRALYLDLKYLREKKEAPIHKPTTQQPWYNYTEKFSLKNILLEDIDVDYLKQAASILKKAAPFQIGTDIDQIIAKLENRIHTNIPDRDQVIQFESHTQASGSQWLDELFEAIRNQLALRITYRPYHHTDANEDLFHPYLLKEYRNRWFLLGRLEDTTYVTIRALDRIVSIRNSSADYIENNLFDPEAYFKHLIGVSLPVNGIIEEVIMKVKKDTVPYIKSKPLHQLQEIVKEYSNGDIKIRIPLYINYELKSVILSYGQGLEVREPKSLREELKDILATALRYYEE